MEAVFPTAPLAKLFTQFPAVREVSLLAGGKELYVVGGALRDLLLGRPLADVDFAAPDDPTPLAQAFARRTGGRWFFLDETRRQSRVAMKTGDGVRTCDFAPFRAPGLEEDLRLRDFTVNALALPLHGGEGASLIDPLGGGEDLAAGRLRGCSPGVFADDPLRVLKGVRHAVTLRFAVAEETAALMREAAPALGRGAPERVRAELAAIFSAEPVAPALHLLRSLGALDVLFPASEPSFDEGVRLAERGEAVLRALAAQPEERDFLAQETEAGLSRAALLKLAAFGRGYGGRMAEWAESFKLSRSSGAVLSALAAADPRGAAELFHLPPGRPSALGVAELGRRAGEALVFLSLWRPGNARAVADALRPILRDYLRHAEGGRVPDLLDGDEVRARLGFPPGPAVGKALAALRREERAGRIRTPDEGRKFLESLAKKWIDNP